MAVQSLYRKWRSQTFGDLVGQEHVVQTLRNALVENRIGHAYLFTGPRGVGKTSMARLLAKAVNCLAENPAERPCGQCEQCVAIAEGRAVDVIEMDAASHTSVEDAREIIERVQFRPSTSRYKVYVIDETHMLSTAAFNALLKTLEEPPDHAIFVLATTEVHKVPATILSRCQRFTFTRHSVTAAAGHLRRIAEAEGLSLEDGVAEAIARAATGSLRDALGVLEQLASFSQGAIRLEQVHDLLGMTAAAEVDALIGALVDGDVGMALRSVNGVAEQGADVRQFTRDLVERLRSLMLLLASGDGSLVDASEDELALLQYWAGRTQTGALVQWIKIFSGLDFQLRTTPYGHLPLELAVVEALVGEWGAGGRAPEARAPGPLAGAAPVARTAPLSRGQSPGTVGVATRRDVPASRPATPPAPSAPVVPAAEPLAVAPPPAPPAAPVSELPPELPPVVLPPDSPPVLPLPDSPPVLPPTATTPEIEPLAAPVVPLGSDPQPPEEDAPATPAAAQPGAAVAQHERALAANVDFSVLERVEALWEDIKRDVRPRSPMVQALLKDVRPFDVEGSTLILLATSPFHKNNLEKPANRKIVEEVIKRHLGSIFAIRCTIESKPETRDLRGQIREARKDELVRAAMNIFEAHIVDIEPYDDQE